MKVNLKKAAALSRALLAAVPSVVYSKSIPVFEEVPDTETFTAEVVSGVDSSVAIVSAAYTIRALLAVANQGEINALLTERAKIETLLTKFKDVPLREASSRVALERAFEAGRAGAPPAYGRVATVEVSAATEYIVESVAAWKKSKGQIEDTLAGLNFTREITIPDDVVEVLKGLDLV